ncbi:MAG: TraR/DksA C4-type zinc finger protein [Burkholderiales bacterium]|nr:TraR/DksA C4-type zinc finger protein [Burkholderiales bacterium]MDE1927007.1 TraR/DksA C4-type zinc finger protein [Burkholderiales bacterium]MDE2159046.1 TraR/DksA C4-type zinc finger protein [Burkholderiales bacterium]
MSSHLSSAQIGLLEADLQQRRRQLESQLAAHNDGLTRAEHAHEMLAQDVRDAARREGERELDLTLSDRETRELAGVKQALVRLQGGDGPYGRCVDCDADIPYARLKIEPQALRCVACAAAHEAVLRRNA